MKSLRFLVFLWLVSSSALAQVNLNTGLVAYYPFNGTFNDASGNGNHGTGNNGVGFGVDQWSNANNAAFFDGIDDWIDVGVPSFTFGHQFSFAFRFKTNSSIHQCIMSRSTFTWAPVNLQFQIAFNHPRHNPKGLYLGTNHTGTCTYDNTGDFSDFGITSEQVSTNQWNCAVITFNNGVKSIYLNGALRARTTATGAYPTTVDSCTEGTFRIGTWWQSDPRYYNGLLDEVRLYNRVLNTQEIDSLCKLVVLPEDTIINKYAAIFDRNGCDNSFLVDTAKGFSTGDTVLMIQMKGASVDSNNASSFGSVLNNNGAGNYELNVVKMVSGNRITLRNKIQRQYNIPDGRVQFVRVPSFTNYTVVRRHSCLPWTGRKGGVFILKVAGTLALNGDIDVSAKGFSGGQFNNGKDYRCDAPDFYYPLSGNIAGEKGGGIAEVSVSKMRGKGRLANGGGGGNSANAGGGGGSNAGAGGAGGNQFTPCNQSLSSGGIGGVALTMSIISNRLYLGGGGGCGQENNGYADAGGYGGGIAIIMAGTLAGGGNYIKANGASCSNNRAKGSTGINGDGQGGGGAGGALLLKVGSFIGSPKLEAKGGDGGNVYATALHGPGGGGGGGSVFFSGSILPPASINIAGGVSGRVVNMGNVTHNAQPGQSGITMSGVSFTMSSAVFQANQMTIGFTDTFVSCVRRQFVSTVFTTTTGVAGYEWDIGAGVTSTAKNPILSFPGIGIYPVRLVVVDSNGCRDSMVKPVVISYPRFAQASGDTAICHGQSAILKAKGGVSYSWSPAATLSDSTTATTSASPSVTLSYVVTMLDSAGCIDRDTVTVTIIPSPSPIEAHPSDTVVCSGVQVQLHATKGTNYNWSPPTGLSNVTIANPIASVKGEILYVVSGTDIAGCLSSDTVHIRQTEDPVVDASSDGTAISCDHKGVRLFASGAVTYSWSPASYVDDSRSVSPLASPLTTMIFTVTGYDSIGCSGTDTISVFAFATAAVFMPDAFTPNNDGRNDHIRPIAYCDFELAEFRIFNRWGECVFYGYDGTHTWDGFYRGKPAPIGVYGYFVRGMTPSTGKEIIVKGNFSLLR